MTVAGDLNRESSDRAFTDPLTGLGNERRFRDKITRLIAERSDDPAPFAIGIVDLDGFRPINDLFGRRAGDEILTQVAARLRAGMDGAGSIVSRMGADEFAFLYPLVFSEESIAEKARMMIEVLSAPYDLGERAARLSASAGCALYHHDEETAEELIQKAEAALYHAKRAGAGRVVVYTAAMEAAGRRDTQIEQALRRAVAAGEVEPYFQPIVDLRSRRIVGFEALARWTDAELGPVPPDVFIPIAEERGIIAGLSRLLLTKAATAASEWPGRLFLSFNLSPSQLVDPNTGLQIISTLAHTGFDPRRLEVEITETGLMGDAIAAGRIVDELRGCGIGLSLDDFGTGQSSLGRLREFRFDKLKIDRSFVAADDAQTEHIVRAILTLCQGLGMEAIAEGIETRGQAERLLSLGCRGGQGFLFGRPADAASTRAALMAAARAGAAQVPAQ